MKRAHTYLDAHPVIAMILGYLLLVAIGLLVLPADPADLVRSTQHHYSKDAT